MQLCGWVAFAKWCWRKELHVKKQWWQDEVKITSCGCLLEMWYQSAGLTRSWWRACVAHIDVQTRSCCLNVSSVGNVSEVGMSQKHFAWDSHHANSAKNNTYNLRCHTLPYFKYFNIQNTVTNSDIQQVVRSQLSGTAVPWCFYNGGSIWMSVALLSVKRSGDHRYYSTRTFKCSFFRRDNAGPSDGGFVNTTLYHQIVFFCRFLVCVFQTVTGLFTEWLVNGWFQSLLHTLDPGVLMSPSPDINKPLVASDLFS